jgi:hypothetical protein
VTHNASTTVIPIVFAVGIDPVGSGLVASLAQPGGNVTGLSIQANELPGKEHNAYTCPAGKLLTTTGKLVNEGRPSCIVWPMPAQRAVLSKHASA